jgi:exo-beta-1,3-glucanase (GH17 family)/glycosyltransferase involved in cell wall biosynthesis
MRCTAGLIRLARRARTAWVALAIGCAVAAANLLAWQLAHRPPQAPDHDGPIGGLAYNASGRWHSPLEGRRPPAEEVARDLALLARHTRRIRSYSAADQPALPAQAQAAGLELMLGAWLGGQVDADQRELAAAVAQAREHSNIRRLIVGNETQLKARLPPNRLIHTLEQARRALRTSGVQVSTGEPWHVWLAQPQLAQHVDFIAIHVLPYWEGESVATAVESSLAQIERVKARFPGREVVVAEIGWPSNGAPLGDARPSAANQALFVRTLLQRAQAGGLDYYLIEAFDQPWKVASEGRAGAYWGLWDAGRAPKFALSGPLLRDPYWRHKAWAASLLGLALALPFLLAAPQLRLRARLALCAAAQLVAGASVVLLSFPLAHYLMAVDLLGLAWVLAALSFIAATLMAQVFEFAERFWPPVAAEPAVPVAPPRPPAEAAPFVSIHLACANEPVAMVRQAVESLLALDWPAFEVIVVDNNTADPQARRALADAMLSHPDRRLRFVQFASLPGFKAGALNQALALTKAQAQWVAVVDADYMVDAGWLRALQAPLGDPTVGVVQAPQAHRDWHTRRIDRMMNWETEGFFRIGMHHRNARNAIIQHGTMTLVRASALRPLRWSEACVCEDTELGLRMLQGGWRAVYVDRVLGRGLLPADFTAYARQRRRWALGAMQILRQHAGALSGRSGLSAAQRYHFIAGWLPWLGDALHLLFTLVMVAFTLGMVYLPRSVEPPLWPFLAPLVVFGASRLLLGPLLYARCVPCGPLDRLGAAVAGMALSHRIARGVLRGLRGGPAVFEVTRKAGPGHAPDRARSVGALAAAGAGATESTAYKGPPFARGIEEELALLASLMFCIGLLLLGRLLDPGPGDDGRLGWIAILAIQSLPYLATVACRGVEWQGRPGAGPSADAGSVAAADP